MKVITLLENRTISKEFKSKHGLSLYIETSKHKILFDTGVDKLFIENANKLGVCLEDIDIVVISHGHCDHGGGLDMFLELNNKAKIYVGTGAFDSHMIKLFGVIKYNIGLNKDLKSNNKIILVDKTIKIDDELTLFGDVKGNQLTPKGNDKLLKKYCDGLVKKDDFEHEISLLVKEKDRYSLFCGCAHKGIVNIINRVKNMIGIDVSTVVGGFHLMGLKIKKSDSKEFLDDLIKILRSYNIEKYYTCHCTGEKAYSYMIERMKNLKELKTGMIIEV